MVEIRAVLLPDAAPLQIRRVRAAFTDVALRPLSRGLVFLAALSLPVLACAFADWFHGGAPRPVQVVAVLLTPPQSGAAAKIARGAPAPPTRPRLAQAKFPQSLALQ